MLRLGGIDDLNGLEHFVVLIQQILSFFDKEFVSIKNGTLLPDMGRQILWPNTGFAGSVGACYNK